MSSRRFPVLVWRDQRGCWTAQWVRDKPGAAAIDRSESDALRQLRDALAWRISRTYVDPESDLEEAELVHVRVDIRPEYQMRDRTFVCAEAVRLMVPAVRGRYAGGMFVGAVPSLGLDFEFSEKRAFRQLIQHAVQAKIMPITPSKLARLLPPPEVRLTTITVPESAATKYDRRDESPWAPATLSAVAEPVVVRSAGVQRTRSGCWEREEEVASLAERLTRERGSLVLLGAAGCGKSTVLREAVRRIDQRDRPTEGRATPRFWRTSAAQLIAGMQFLGQWQERCESVIQELDRLEGTLCVNNMLDLVRVGGSSPASSLAAFFLGFMQRGTLRLVTEASSAEIDACRRLYPAFGDAMHALAVPSLTADQSVRVLSHMAGTVPGGQSHRIERGVVETVYRLFRRFEPHQAFPGHAAPFLATLLDRAEADESRVTVRATLGAFVDRTGLPERILRDDVTLSHDELTGDLRQRVIGQDRACSIASDFILSFKAGINDPRRPIGVLLFCGPTGVGKTELSKSISKFLFSAGRDSDRLVRLDMSEFSGPGSADRLIAAPGDDPSDLVHRLRRQPFCVLLLDEIEKAHPSVFDALLGVFDEGRLTDPYGRVTSFRSAVIIMTSNIGGDREEPFGFADIPATTFEGEVGRVFRPEFVNRIDSIVTFDSLGEDAIRRIVVKELEALRAREGLTSREHTLEWDDEVVTALMQAGHDPRYGVRPLQRIIETRVVTPISEFLVRHQQLRLRLVLKVDADGRVCVGDG